MGKEESDYKPIIRILKDILGEVRSHSTHKQQIAFDCPVCSYEIKGLENGDGKGNLEVNYKYGVYKCWSCGESHNTHGSLYKLIKKYGKPSHLRNYKLFSPDYNENRSEKRKYKKVRLPIEFISFENVSDGFRLTHYYKRAKNYLIRRNINDDLIKKHHIGFCYEGEYANRIIIPSLSKKNKVNYFVARTYEPYIKPKYKNPEAEKQKIIWNKQSIDWSKPIYLVEGVFDHIFLPNSIPLLGKVISDELFDILYEKAIKIVIVLDGDAFEDTIKLYRKLDGGKLMNKIWYVKLDEDVDIADLCGNLSKYEEKQFK